jgi:hypothetical protein
MRWRRPQPAKENRTSRQAKMNRNKFISPASDMLPSRPRHPLPVKAYRRKSRVDAAAPHLCAWSRGCCIAGSRPAGYAHRVTFRTNCSARALKFAQPAPLLAYRCWHRRRCGGEGRGGGALFLRSSVLCACVRESAALEGSEPSDAAHVDATQACVVGGRGGVEPKRGCKKGRVLTSGAGLPRSFCRDRL